MKSKPINQLDRTKIVAVIRPICLGLIALILLAGCKPSPDVIKAAETRMLRYATELGYTPSGELLKGCTGLPGRYACIVMFKTKLNAKEFAAQITDIGIRKLSQSNLSGPKVTKNLLFGDFTQYANEWKHIPNSSFLAAESWSTTGSNGSSFMIVDIEFIELTLVPNSYTWNGRPITDNVVRLEVDFELTASVCSLQENCVTVQPTITTTAVQK